MCGRSSASVVTEPSRSTSGPLVIGRHLLRGDLVAYLEKAWLDQIAVILTAMKYLREDNFPGVLD